MRYYIDTQAIEKNLMQVEALMRELGVCVEVGEGGSLYVSCGRQKGRIGIPNTGEMTFCLPRQIEEEKICVD